MKQAHRVPGELASAPSGSVPSLPASVAVDLYVVFSRSIARRPAVKRMAIEARTRRSGVGLGSAWSAPACIGSDLYMVRSRSIASVV